MIKAVLDTNIFVAASFNKRSSSAKILHAANNDKVKIIWDDDTYDETKHIIKKIPPIKWSKIKEFFRSSCKHTKETKPDLFNKVEDKSDRKFIALASSADASLITNDYHLLKVKTNYDIDVCKPSEFVERIELL